MDTLSFTITTEIPASPQQVYNAWLDSEAHNAMTDGAGAIQSPIVGAKHEAHGDYISGENLEIIPNKKIVQSWRTTAFKADEKKIYN